MKKLVTFYLIIAVFILIPNIKLTANENASQASSEDSSANSAQEIGTASVIILVVGAVATVAILAASLWGGITTSRGIEKRKQEKRSKKIAGAIFNEATTGYGEKANVDILAKFYCMSSEQVIDAIARLSATGKIDIYKSLEDNEIAYQSLLVLRNDLTRISSKNKGFQTNIKVLSKNINSNPNLLEKVDEWANKKVINVAEFYRDLFKEQ